MKSVLLSIQPKWCELIASGKKTVEIRKTKPKLKPPFKCYIYETQGRYKDMRDCKTFKFWDIRQKVIGEFVCDTIFPISVTYSDPNSKIALKEFPWTCLTDKQIIDYLGNGKRGYGWHISDLKIYDKPKEINELSVIDNEAVKNCEYRYRVGQPKYVTRNDGWLKGGWGCFKTFEMEWCEKCKTKSLKRPPQSWCYVEELEE